MLVVEKKQNLNNKIVRYPNTPRENGYVRLLWKLWKFTVRTEMRDPTVMYSYIMS